jgi:hypothetical protein
MIGQVITTIQGNVLPISRMGPIMRVKSDNFDPEYQM